MKTLRRYLPAAIVIAVILAVLPLVDQETIFNAIRENRESMLAYVDEHPVLAALIFVAGYALAVAVSLPGAVFLTLLGGFLFGTWLGGLLVVIAATIGALIIFAVARTAIGQSLRTRIGPSFERIAQGFKRDGASYMLVMRLVPIFPFWVVNLVPAFLGVSTKVFALSTLFGIMPASFVYASLGAGLGAVLDEGGSPDLGLITQPHVLLPLLGLALLALVPVFYRKLRAQRTNHAVP
jgi:uncharacterized membrane protein YdjX (TVP38/TMEM64 family)